jgi:hypothetical protein
MRMRYMALQAQWGGAFTVARNSKIDCKLSRKEVILSREDHIADERCSEDLSWTPQVYTLCCVVLHRDDVNVDCQP